jgi:hypothetical protein
MAGQSPSELAQQIDVDRLLAQVGEHDSRVQRDETLIRTLQGRMVADEARIANHETRITALEVPIPLVMALPAGPVDGQLAIFRTSNPPYVDWLLQYRTAYFALDGYGWVVMGGGLLTSTVLGGSVTASLTYVVPPTTAGPDLIAPLDGIYTVDHGCEVTNNAAGGGGAMSYQIGAAAATDTERAIAYSPIANAPMSTSLRLAKTLVAGTVLSTRIRAASAGTATIAKRSLSLRPARLR